METPLRLARDRFRGHVGGRGSAHSPRTVALFSFGLFSLISCEITKDEIIFVFCEARVSCKWKKITITHAAGCSAVGTPSFEGPRCCAQRSSEPFTPRPTPAPSTRPDLRGLIAVWEASLCRESVFSAGCLLLAYLTVFVGGEQGFL